MPPACGFIVDGYLRGSCFCTTIASRLLAFGDWLHNAQQAFLFEFLLDSLFSYDSMLTWKTGCASARSVSPGNSAGVWFHLVAIRGTQPPSFCFLHLHNMCFHLGFPCQYVSSTQLGSDQSSDSNNRFNPKCVFVQLCLCDL